MKYAIEVHAQGYEDFSYPVEASTKQQASGTNNRLLAIIAWEKHNDIEDSEELPFTRIVKL